MDGQGFYPEGFYPQYEVQHQAQAPMLQYPMQLGASNVPIAPNVPSTAPATPSRPSTGTEEESPEADGDSSGKRVYEKWTDQEQKLLVSLWGEDFDRIESKESQKAWDEIADQVNNKFTSKRPKRPTLKFKNKMKYLIDRYKKAKDWNLKQTGGNRKKSIFYDEIDAVLGCREIVALKHVEEAGSSTSNNSAHDESGTNSYSNDEEEDGNKSKKKMERNERKKKRKRAIKEEEEEEERKFFKAAVSGLEAQREDMNSFVQNFNRIQTEQLNTMNTLVGALTKFLEKQ